MTLTSHSIIFLGPQHARFSPKLYYWIFIVRTSIVPLLRLRLESRAKKHGHGLAFLICRHIPKQAMLRRNFIQPCDIFSLVLQSVGGALSSTSSGGSKTAVDVSIAGLSFQVFTLCVFIALGIEFAVRYTKAQRVEQGKMPLPTSFKMFVVFLTAAITFILIRCAYRIDELSNGYNGPLIHNEPLFIALEGA